MILKVYHSFTMEGEFNSKPYQNTYCVGRRVIDGVERSYALCKIKGAHSFKVGAEYILDVIATDNGVNIIKHFERR